MTYTPFLNPNMAYVDRSSLLMSGYTELEPVHTITSKPIDNILSIKITRIHSYVLKGEDRIIIDGQKPTKNNGIYKWSEKTSRLTRTKDFNGSLQGKMFVRFNSLSPNRTIYVINSKSIIVGSDNVVWEAHDINTFKQPKSNTDISKPIDTFNIDSLISEKINISVKTKQQSNGKIDNLRTFRIIKDKNTGHDINVFGYGLNFGTSNNQFHNFSINARSVSVGNNDFGINITQTDASIYGDITFIDGILLPNIEETNITSSGVLVTVNSLMHYIPMVKFLPKGDGKVQKSLNGELSASLIEDDGKNVNINTDGFVYINGIQFTQTNTEKFIGSDHHIILSGETIKINSNSILLGNMLTLDSDGLTSRSKLPLIWGDIQLQNGVLSSKVANLLINSGNYLFDTVVQIKKAGNDMNPALSLQNLHDRAESISLFFRNNVGAVGAAIRANFNGEDHNKQSGELELISYIDGKPVSVLKIHNEVATFKKILISDHERGIFIEKNSLWSPNGVSINGNLITEKEIIPASNISSVGSKNIPFDSIYVKNIYGNLTIPESVKNPKENTLRHQKTLQILKNNEWVDAFTPHIIHNPSWNKGNADSYIMDGEGKFSISINSLDMDVVWRHKIKGGEWSKDCDFQKINMFGAKLNIRNMWQISCKPKYDLNEQDGFLIKINFEYLKN